jgi:hypothetical protein
MRSVDRGDAGQVLSRERTKIGMPTPWTGAEGNMLCSDNRELHENPARSETLFMYRSILRGNREILLLSTDGAVFRVGHSEEIIQR